MVEDEVRGNSQGAIMESLEGPSKKPDFCLNVINFKPLQGFNQERELTDSSHCMMAGVEPEYQKRGYFRSQGAMMMTQTREEAMGMKRVKFEIYC